MYKLRYGAISVGLIITLSIMMVGFRSIGLAHSANLNCVILDNADGSVTAVDANNFVQTELTRDWPKLRQIGGSPDGKYSILEEDRIAARTLTSSIFIQTNASGKMARLPDLEFMRGAYWSPDSRYVAITGLTPNRQSQILLVGKSDGTDYHTIQMEGPSVPAWSDDGKYLAYNRLNDIAVIWVEDFNQNRVDDRPQSPAQWLPGSHKLVYLRGQPYPDTLKTLDFDTRTENTYKFNLQDGNWLNFNWTSDGHYLAIYEDNGHNNTHLTLFDLSHGNLRKLESLAYEINFTRYFWTPNNQAIALVTAQDSALIAFYLEENRSETLLPDGFKELLSVVDSSHYLFLRQEAGSLSLQLLNWENQQVSLIKGNIAFIWPTRLLPDGDSYFIIEKTASTYSVDVFDVVTNEQIHVIDKLPTRPEVREMKAAVAVIWSTASGGGLARYSLPDKSLALYHVDITRHWDLTKTRLSFSPDRRYVAVSLQEPDATLLQIASSGESLPVTLYQSSEWFSWAGILNWSSDSSQLLYGIANGGPAKLVRNDGSELNTFASSGNISFSTCDDYFDSRVSS